FGTANVSQSNFGTAIGFGSSGFAFGASENACATSSSAAARACGVPNNTQQQQQLLQHSTSHVITSAHGNLMQQAAAG
ncbi:unnamed protein product, partial [Amoebophrya sp. A120]